MKVVINSCFGGFSLSVEAVQWLHKNKYEGAGFRTPISKYFGDLSKEGPMGFKRSLEDWQKYLKTKESTIFLTIFTEDLTEVLSDRVEDIDRTDPILIKCVETLGSKKASGSCAKLSIVEIPDGVDYTVEEYDGNEHIAEKHRTWSK